MQFLVSAVVECREGAQGAARAGWLSFLRDAQAEIGPMLVKRGEDDKSGFPLDSTDAATAAEANEGFMASAGGFTAEVVNDRAPGSKTVDAVRAILWWEDPPEDKISSLLLKLQKWGQHHGLLVATAGASDERRSQMFVTLKLAKGSIETFAGKNHREYLPGLFWWNWWAGRVLDRVGVDPETLPSPWRSDRIAANGSTGVVVRGGYEWRAWKPLADDAAGWAEEHPGVFSKRRLNASVPDRLNEITALRFLRRWK